MNVCGKSQCGKSRSRRGEALLLSTFVLMSAFGCGGREPNTILDATALLERYEQVRQRHDPDHFSEVDLGEFTVTQRRETAIFFIRFHLYAVVSDKEIEEFTKLLETHGERIRGKIRETVQSSELAQLEDPTLGWLKSELIQWINRSVNTPILRDVVFGDFSFERG
jgi:hypothetical protein